MSSKARGVVRPPTAPASLSASDRFARATGQHRSSSTSATATSSSSPGGPAIKVTYQSEKWKQRSQSTERVSEQPRSQTVVVANSEGHVICPECGETYVDDAALRQHVFDCRLQHGVDPLLPLEVLVRQPDTNLGSRDGGLRSMQPVPFLRKTIVPRTIRRSMLQPHRNGNEFTATPPSSRRSSAPADTAGEGGSSSSPWQPALHGFLQHCGQGRAAVSVRRLAAKLDRRELPFTLDLSCCALSTIQCEILAQLLRPSRRRAALPISELSLEGTSFESPEDKTILLRSLLSNPAITDVDFGVAPEQQQQQEDSSLQLAVIEHCTINSQRNRATYSMDLLRYQAAQFIQWNEERKSHRQQCLELALQQRETIMHEETEERDQLGRDMVNLVNEQLRWERHQRTVQRKQRDRDTLVELESLHRQKHISDHANCLLDCCREAEEEARVLKRGQHNNERLFLRLEERESVFRARLRESKRFELEALERLYIERSIEMCTASLLEESSRELEMMNKQRIKHKAYATWRKRQRDEVEQFFKMQRTMRDSLEKEEDSYFTGGRDKLHKTIEVILMRCAAQREAVEHQEEDVRNASQNAFLQWYEIGLSYMLSECKLIANWRAAVKRGTKRSSILRILPQASLSALPTDNAYFCSATPGHNAPDPTPLFSADVSLCVAMPDSWESEFNTVQQKCRSLAIDERTLHSDHLNLVHRTYRAYGEAHQTAFDSTVDHLLRQFGRKSVAMRAALQMSSGNHPSPQPTTTTDVAAAQVPTKVGKKRQQSSAATSTTTAHPHTAEQPITDQHYLELVQSSVRWRGAWSDAVPTSEVLQQKRTIRSASIEVSFVHAQHGEVVMPPTDRDKESIRSSSRLLTKSSRSCVIDGTLCKALSVSSDSAGEESQADEDEGEDAVSISSAALLEVNRPSAARSIELELFLPTPELQDADSSNDSQHSSPLAAAIDLSGGVEDLQEAVSSELRQLFYQCLADGAALQKHCSVDVVRIQFSIDLSFDVQDVYCTASDAPDIFGYAPVVPMQNRTAEVIAVTGALTIVVVPSNFVLPIPVAQLAPVRTLVEAQMEEVVVFPTLETVTNPVKAVVSKVQGTVMSVEPLPHMFEGALLTLDVLPGSKRRPNNTADRLSMRDDLPALKFETMEKTRAIKAILWNGAMIAEVVEGSIQSTKFVNASNSMHLPSCKVVLRLGNTRQTGSSPVDGEIVKLLLSRVRFHNYEEGPAEGRRVIRAVLAAQGLTAHSTLDTQVDVECIDKPTELRLAFNKLTHRAPFLSTPTSLKSMLRNYFLPLFPQCLVLDEDTDRFSGGSVRVTLSNALKGDSLVFVPDTKLLYPTDDALHQNHCPLEIINDNEIVFEDRVVGTLEKGSVARDSDFSGHGCFEIFITLAQEEQCSISAVQCMLRHVAFFSNPGLRALHNTTQQREVVVDLQIKDDEQPTFIKDTVTVRGAGHSIQLPDKAAVIEIKEGAAPVKVGNLDLSSDRIKPINSFHMPWIWAYVADGYSEGDTIWLKPDDAEYRMVEPRKSGTASLGSGGVSPGKSAKQPQALKSAQSFKDRVKQATHKNSSASLADVVAQVTAKQLQMKRDIMFTNGTCSMANVQPSKDGGIWIQFSKDTKKEAVTRRHVVTMLKNLTFFAPPNPAVTNKVLRVVFCDEPAATPSQVLVNVRIATVDDVTEIRVKSPRKMCVPSAEPNFPLLPFGRAILLDDDTEYFDGGSLVVQCIAGASRGDSFSFVPPQNQAAIAQRWGAPLDGFTGTAFDDFRILDERSFLLNGVEVGRIDMTNREGGTTEVKISFLRDGTGKLVPIHAASYMMNSILFGNAESKMRENSRQFLVRIRDAENPVEGKTRIGLDFTPPLIAAQGGDTQFLLRQNLPVAAGSTLYIGTRVVVQSDSLGNVSTQGGRPGGSVSFVKRGSCWESCSVRFDPAPLAGKGLEYSADTGEIAKIGSSPPLLVLRWLSKTHLEFEFGQRGNEEPLAPINKALMQLFFHCIYIHVDSTLQPSLRRLNEKSISNLSFTSPDVVTESTLLFPSGAEGPTVSPVTSSLLRPTKKSSTASLSPAVTPRPRSRQASYSVEGEDDEVLQVHWKLHDGRNMSVVQTHLTPR